MAKPDVKCGLSVVDRLARIRITSVAGLSVPSDDQPFVNEHETGGFYASMHETGYVPSSEEITTIAKATAAAQILACKLLEARIREARRAAQANLDQGELAFDGEDAEARAGSEGQGDGQPETLSLPAGRLALDSPRGLEPIELGESGNIIEADFTVEGVSAADADDEVECAGCGRLVYERNGTEIAGKGGLYCGECAEGADAELVGAGAR